MPPCSARRPMRWPVPATGSSPTTGGEPAVPAGTTGPAGAPTSMRTTPPGCSSPSAPRLRSWSGSARAASSRMALAARRSDVVERVVAWEPPALGLVPGGEEISAAIMAPVEAHLAAHPGDFVGAQAILLTQIVGFPVSVDDPAFAAARANAEPMIRDEPAIPLRPFSAAELAGVDLTVALGAEPLDLMVVAADQLADWTSRPTVRVDVPHEVYLSDPSVLAELVGLASADGCRVGGTSVRSTAATLDEWLSRVGTGEPGRRSLRRSQT